MRESSKFKHEARGRRAARVRRKVRGTSERPRLSVRRSNRHIFAQLIDDDRGVTMAWASSLKMSAAATEDLTAKVAVAKAVGAELAKRAQDKGIDEVVFDRAGYKYHGRVAALAEGARSGGLKL
jgi:large subunit ribosomal protein L18